MFFVLLMIIFLYIAALQCQSCADPSDPLCSIQTSVTCPSGSMCATIYTQANGLPPLTVFRGCAQSSQCPATGSFTFSANVGIIQVTQTAECCNSDNCNSGPASGKWSNSNYRCDDYQ
uniref:UPAR/Ly6 domain-containing protein n=1 Tax=Gouania willdenowi TaxID=441366 RepID=A0A8C5DIF8_GOUWI